MQTVEGGKSERLSRRRFFFLASSGFGGEGWGGAGRSKEQERARVRVRGSEGGGQQCRHSSIWYWDGGGGSGNLYLLFWGRGWTRRHSLRAIVDGKGEKGRGGGGVEVVTIRADADDGAVPCGDKTGRVLLFFRWSCRVMQTSERRGVQHASPERATILVADQGTARSWPSYDRGLPLAAPC